MNKLIAQFAKFGVVGVIAFIIDYGTMAILTEVFGVPYMISTPTGFIVSVIFNYFASMKYVFKRRDDMSRTREFIIFVVLSAIGCLINQALMMVGVELIPWPADFKDHAYLLVKFFVTAIVMVYNFITRKIFLENKDADA